MVQNYEAGVPIRGAIEGKVKKSDNFLGYRLVRIVKVLLLW
jgi:hypothetical protein